MIRVMGALAAVLCQMSGTISAQVVSQDAQASFIFDGERINIDRNTPADANVGARFAATGAGCDRPCIAPMVDARLPAERALGFIPGTVNLPSTTLGRSNTFKNDILRVLGAKESDRIFDFTEACKLLVYDIGPGADDAGRLVRNQLSEGYPIEKISYYRGGMQVWSVSGFSIEKSNS